MTQPKKYAARERQTDGQKMKGGEAHGERIQKRESSGGESKGRGG